MCYMQARIRKLKRAKVHTWDKQKNVHIFQALYSNCSDIQPTYEMSVNYLNQTVAIHFSYGLWLPHTYTNGRTLTSIRNAEM